jgi:hypothetical protein
MEMERGRICSAGLAPASAARNDDSDLLVRASALLVLSVAVSAVVARVVSLTVLAFDSLILAARRK